MPRHPNPCFAREIARVIEVVEHNIDNGNIVGDRYGKFERLFAQFGCIAGKTRLTQSFFDKRGDLHFFASPQTRITLDRSG